MRVGSLHPVRDLTYVSDTVAGLICAATQPDTAGEVFNLGTGKAQSMEKVLEEILDLVDREVPVEKDPSRERPNTSEVERLVADSQRSKDVLGWKSRIELSEGLRRTRAWVESHREARHIAPISFPSGFAAGGRGEGGSPREVWD